jgi:hypothetical protein
MSSIARQLVLRFSRLSDPPQRWTANGDDATLMNATYLIAWLFALCMIPTLFLLVRVAKWSISIFGDALRALYGAHKYRRWSLTKGTIELEMLENEGEGGETEYYVSLGYNYVLRGTAYRSFQSGFSVYPRCLTVSERYAAAWISRLGYRDPGDVDVYYDPTHPADAVLKPGVNATVLGRLVLALGSLFIAPACVALAVIVFVGMLSMARSI